MASALTFLVNENPSQDITMLDSFIDHHVFEHLMFQNLKELIKNSEEIEIDSSYDFRPDKLSVEYYNTNFFYPVILAANKIGSILQFKSEYLNNKCLIPNIDVVKNILSKYQEKQNQILINEKQRKIQ
jgi:hypothetical protein